MIFVNKRIFLNPTDVKQDSAYLPGILKNSDCGLIHFISLPGFGGGNGHLRRRMQSPDRADGVVPPFFSLEIHKINTHNLLVYMHLQFFNIANNQPKSSLDSVSNFWLILTTT